MGKQVAQGTAFETSIVRAFGSYGARARRTAKAGQAHEADVIVNGATMIPVVAWKHYTPAGSRRKTATFYVLSGEDFHRLVGAHEPGRFGYFIQAKASQRLSIPAVYAGLVEWVKKHGKDAA